MIFKRLQRAPIIVLLVLLAYRTPAAIASGRQISGTPSCPESLGGFLRPNDISELYYAVVPSNPPGANNGLLCARLEVKREGWIGFGISLNGRMVGSDAIIGLPNAGSVLKYDLLQKSTRSIVAMGDDSQTLIDTSIEQVDGMTIMEFTKLLVEDGENAIMEEGLNNFLCAVGSSNTLGYHAIRSPFTKDFSDDIVSGGATSDTTSTVVATTASATSAPTDSPISSQPQSSSPTESTGQCQVGPNADPPMACGAGEFCQLDTGVCNNRSGVHEGTCAESPFICSADYDPVCACDGSTYSNACTAHSVGVSVSRMGECMTGSPIKNTTSTMATSAAVTTVAATSSGETATVDSSTTTVATATSASMATSDASTTTTKATSSAIDGNVPTSEPTKPPNTEVPTKSPNDLDDEGVDDGIPKSSCALNQSRAFSFYVVTAFMAILAVTLA
mmetsp:Transcript_1209/g.1781  ORF Transcript_1209/g.1781 Transcript_1209/m.1781 type:complete len:446 (-) Transcript_1209:164-1501(-)